jgi:hypothetical protein
MVTRSPQFFHRLPAISTLGRPMSTLNGTSCRTNPSRVTTYEARLLSATAS